MPDINVETDKIVYIQSEKMESKYVLHKKRVPLINKSKNLIQFDSADYFMQQQQQLSTSLHESQLQ